GAATKRLRSHPSNLIWLVPAKGVDGPAHTVSGHRARAGPAAGLGPARPDAALGEPLRQPARDRRRGGAGAGAVVQAGAAGDPEWVDRREHPAGTRWGERSRRARPGDGAAARAAGATGLLRADGAERRAEPRLVDVRADHHLDGRRGPLRARLRLRGALAVGARLRRGVARAGTDGAGRVRP